MSRIAVVAVCALFTLLGLIPVDRIEAQQEQDPFGDAASRPARGAGNLAQDAEDRIEATLDSVLKAPLAFIEVPLQDVIQQFQDEYRFPIIFDNSALNEVAISTETELSISVGNISLRSALDLMFKEPGLEDLTYIIDNEVLLITTEDRANETLLTVVYRVDDFGVSLPTTQDGTSDHTSYDTLVDAITSCVEFDAWSSNGTGKGELTTLRPGMLVVSQTRSVHRKIEVLLANLREVKSEIEAGTSGSGF